MYARMYAKPICTHKHVSLLDVHTATLYIEKAMLT